jgi:hypothetical protein
VLAACPRFWLTTVSTKLSRPRKSSGNCSVHSQNASCRRRQHSASKTHVTVTMMHLHTSVGHSSMCALRVSSCGHVGWNGKVTSSQLCGQREAHTMHGCAGLVVTSCAVQSVLLLTHPKNPRAHHLHVLFCAAGCVMLLLPVVMAAGLTSCFTAVC